MKDTHRSTESKQQKTTAMRKSEVNFLRFLRTSERPQNYATIKIIGKGAFGEVKLVQRKHDGKIYALKSLIKAEMVSQMSSLGGCSTDSYSSRKTSWRTSELSVTSSPMLIVHGSSSCTLRSRTPPFSTC